MWDADSATNMRADIKADDVTETGFDLVFTTWGDTRWARVRLAWFSIGEAVDEDAWELY